MVPSFEAFMLPALQALKDGQPLKRDSLRLRCAELMGLTEEDLQERIKSNKKFKIVDRLQWATYYLLKSGLILRPNPATEQITAEGIALLNSGITILNRQILREKYASYREFEQQTRDAAKAREKLKKSTKSKSKGKKQQSKVSTETFL